MRRRWYEDAVVYALDVERFFDANGDGIGDFRGLAEKLPYIASLGANCIWLLPFYPTPNRDNGYDVSDFYGVDTRLGSPGDFVEFMEEADRFGLRVIVDLVMSHTSDEHPWFQAARRDPESRYRDYYIWSEEPEGGEDELVLTGEEESPWEYDEEAGLYYFHRFYHFQPDLNTGHPGVREELDKLVSFWCRLGAAGVRVDAAPYLVEKAASGSGDGHGFLRELRRVAEEYVRQPLLLGETDVKAQRLEEFFGDGDELNALFNFLVNNYLFLALARGSAEPLRRGLEKLPEPPPGCTWGNFLRNHDELDLDRLDDDERDEVIAAFGPEPEMQIFGGSGIRRRLAPLLSGDERKIKLAYSLLFSLPGTPVLRYGDDIGMGDDLSLEGRDAVRTPMQWSPEANGGFSSADAERLPAPVIADGRYGYERVNVAAQQRDAGSILNTVRRLAWLRRQLRAIDSHAWSVVETESDAVLCLRYEREAEAVVALHNLSEEDVELDAGAAVGGLEGLVELVSDSDYEPVGERATVGACGYRWWRGRAG